MGLGKDSGYVSLGVKYCVFFFNLFFWLVGSVFISVGIWAYVEKNRFSHQEVKSIYDIVFDVSIVIIVVGCIIFLVAFTGCVGALRENICLLKFFSYALGVIFILEVVGAVLCFVFSREVKAKVTDVLRSEGIPRYRDDPDFHDVINWVQETFGCCGVGLKGYKEWSNNAYFNCTDENRSSERCAVPYSCCLQQNNLANDIVNTMCGYEVQHLSILEASEKVYTAGCVEVVLRMAEDNLYVVGGIVIGLAVPQLVALFLARILANQIEDQKEAWV